MNTRRSSPPSSIGRRCAYPSHCRPAGLNPRSVCARARATHAPHRGPQRHETSPAKPWLVLVAAAIAPWPRPHCAAPMTSRPQHTPEHAHARLSLACFARAALKAAPLPGLGLALGRLDRTTLGPCLLAPYLADEPPPTRRRRSTTTKSGRRRCWTTSQPPQLLTAAVEAFPLCRRCLQSALSTTRCLWNSSSPSST